MQMEWSMLLGLPAMVVTMVVAAVVGLLPFAPQVMGEPMAPLRLPSDHRLIIPNKYIVVFREDTMQDLDGSEMGQVSAQSMHQLHHANWLQTRLAEPGEAEASKLEHAFRIDALAGYTGYFSPGLIEEIRQRGEVEYVEADQLMYAMEKPSWSDALAAMTDLQQLLFRDTSRGAMHKLHNGRIQGPNQMLQQMFEATTTALTQTDAPWGLFRLSHTSNEGLGGGEGPAEYNYPSSAGDNVDVYVIDTGIKVEHEEFEGRARWGATIPLFDLDIDGNGHGTHCAGTIGSRRFGVAKRAGLVAVKVLRTNGFGTNSDVIKGVEWVTKEHRRRVRRGGKSVRSVANMSLGGGRSATLEKAVNRAVAEGVHFAVAAGNDGDDACLYSPAAADGPITVGASTAEDTVAYFSNHGKCVDVFAPGLNIKSTWIGESDAVNTISGTSMATPHVAGVLALYLGEAAGRSEWTPKALKQELQKRALAGALQMLPSPLTPNLLVNTGYLLQNLRLDEGAGTPEKPEKSEKEKEKEKSKKSKPDTDANSRRRRKSRPKHQRFEWQ